jgi:N-acetylglucosamine-6-sulfatase
MDSSFFAKFGAAALTLGLLASCSSSTTASNPTGGSAPPGSRETASSEAPPGGRANIVLLLTDDLNRDEVQFMPHLKELITDQGMSFDSYFDNVTLCCPARTAILRGQYSHNSGILTNGGSNGGFETAYASGIEKATVATALHDVGYRTGLFGKYLNGYPNTAGNDYVPPGWDTWSSSSKGNAYGEFNYTLNENGRQVSYGKKAEDYGTDVYVRQADDFMTQAAKDGKPFLTYLAVYAPHQPATPAPRHANLFPDGKAPRTPGYDESDVGDKPQYIKDLPPIDAANQKVIDDIYRKRIQSLQAVDEGIATIVDQLQRNGQLANTYFVFTSDNGFHLGQHRMPAGKQTAYEEDIHLPLMVRGPGITAGVTSQAIVGNVDLAPTFAAIAGATMADDPDGRSIVPLLHDRSGAATPSWRQAYLLEHWTETSTGTATAGGPQLEPDDPDQGGDPTATTGGGTSESSEDGIAEAPATTRARRSAAAATRIPEYQGVRVAGFTYVEYVTGEKELYDLRADPDQLTNIAVTADPALVASLHATLEQLRTCRGEQCRSVEDAPVGR